MYTSDKARWDLTLSLETDNVAVVQMGDAKVTRPGETTMWAQTTEGNHRIVMDAAHCEWMVCINDASANK